MLYTSRMEYLNKQLPNNVFGQFLKVATERERSLLFVQQMRQIWNVIQYEVAGKGECFFT